MRIRHLWLIVLMAVAILRPSTGAAAEQSIPVSAFSKGLWTGWEAKAFKGETAYAFTFDTEKNATVLEARSRAAASGRYRKIKIDLVTTPFLNWSWKVTEAVTGVDENTKAGDDFSARLYVVVERGIMGLSSLSMNYVWASQHPTGSAWRGASEFTGSGHRAARPHARTGANALARHRIGEAAVHYG